MKNTIITSNLSNMKRYILLILSLISLALYATDIPEPAEPTAEKIKELREFKIKYLIQEMNLPADKQAEFIKVYTQYDNERTNLFREIYRKAKSIRKTADPGDAEYLSAAENMATAKQREGAIEHKYFNKFKTILSPKQLYTLKRSEQKFDRKLGEMRPKRQKGKR